MYYIAATDGTLLAVEDINPNSKRVVVLVHGWPLCKEMYEYQKDRLAEANYRVVSFDLRGFGKSQTSGKGYDYDQLATDLYTILSSLNIPNVTLVGFSMGGAICVHYMALFENKFVEQLILLGAAAPSFGQTTNNPYGHPLEYTNQIIEKGYQDRPAMVTDFGNQVFALHHSDAFQKWFTDLAFRASGIGIIGSAISLRDEDVFHDLSKIHVPTHIIHGKRDQICPFGFATIMNREIADSKLYPFELSGHGIFYDELERFNKLFLYIIENKKN